MGTPESPSICFQTRGVRRAAYHAQWRATRKAELAAKNKLYRATNREAILAKRKVRRDAQRDSTLGYRREYHRAWRLANPERSSQLITSAKGARRAREYGNRVERISWKDVWSTFNGTCPICSNVLHIGVEKFHFDHRVALARGGTHTTANLQIAHAVCNLKKNRY